MFDFWPMVEDIPPLTEEEICALEDAVGWQFSTNCIDDLNDVLIGWWQRFGSYTQFKMDRTKRRQIDSLLGHAHGIASKIEALEDIGSAIVSNLAGRSGASAEQVKTIMEVLEECVMLHSKAFDAVDPYVDLICWTLRALNDDPGRHEHADLGLSRGGPFQRFVECLRDQRPGFGIHKPVGADRMELMHQWIKARHGKQTFSDQHLTLMRHPKN